MHRTRFAVSGLAMALCACTGGGAPDGATGGPALLSLQISPLDMAPAFSPDIHDYVLRCSAGDNAVSVTVNAAAPVEASILGVGSSPASGSQSATVTLQEDSAIVIDVTSGTDAQEYWVRCLPHDFPVVSMTRNPQAGSPTPGWYLLGNGIAAEGEGGFAMVLDGNGTPVWYHRVAATGAFNVDQLPDGSISFIAELGAYGSDPNAKYTILQLAPWQVQYVQASGSPTDEHELQVLPNGDRLVLSYPLIAGVDLTGLASYGADSTIADCVIEELDQAGALVWQWRGSDHIDPVKESTSPQSNVIGGQSVVDVYHCNSIEPDSEGNLMVSARDMDAVFFVGKENGRITWKLGGAPYSRDGAQILQVVGDPLTTFSHQHDARFQPNGDVSLFDDHTNAPGVARGVEYALDMDAGTATLVWQYQGAAVSTAMGSFRRYPDGSNIIAWGLAGTLAFSEVDDQGNDLLDVSFGKGDSTYRAVKVAPEALDLDVMRTTAGHP